DVSAKLNPSFSFILNTFFRKSIEYVIMTLLYPIYWNLAIYVTEITKAPIQYPAVALIMLFSSLGGFATLAVASFTTNKDFNWRIAFFIGAIIAVVGATARTRLREPPDFADVLSVE
ncbi:MAG: hypothetical protein LBH67_01995, partial [Rickettsia sp.]|nr:hypothetical protein [Rickettsia sp.]